MFGAKAGWNQDLDLFTNQLLMGIAKELFTLDVGQNYSALLIDDQHRIVSGIQHRAKVGFD